MILDGQKIAVEGSIVQCGCSYGRIELLVKFFLLFARARHGWISFTCQFKGIPEETFTVTKFQLTEHLSELFTLSLTAVSSLPSICFDDMLGFACSLTVTRNGKPIRTVRGLLS